MNSANEFPCKVKEFGRTTVRKCVAVEQLAEQPLQLIEQLKKKLKASNAKYRAAADTHRRHNTFQMGDMIMVFLRTKHGES